MKKRECAVCHVRGSPDMFRTCALCKAVLYCSEECLKNDWCYHGDREDQSHSHKFWCDRMKKYMTQASELRSLPFFFMQETSGDDFDFNAYRHFLEAQGVYNQGGWRREAPGSLSLDRMVLFGELPEENDLYVLPVESSILEEDPRKGKDPIGTVSDWHSYYSQRGFRMDSPIAILLQWPLTAYYILQHRLPVDAPSWQDIMEARQLNMDIVGVEQEVDILPVFKELGYLLADLTIDIIMYGPSISKKVHNKTYSQGNVSILVKQGLYHSLAGSAHTPQVVIGFNAGLAAYGSWQETVKFIMRAQIPAYFTDFCQHSCEYSRMALEKQKLATISEPIINPFRSPVRCLADDNDIPQYSNGFLYQLKHPS